MKDLGNFAETHKNAYSHGLESIYTLENIDPKSIRKLHDPVNEPSSKKPALPIRKKTTVQTLQMEFDFGPQFRKWLLPFILNEPIHVLELTRHAEKCLIERGKHLLKDIVHFDLREFVFFKGMGQGHIDEVRQKLSHYLAGKETERTTTVDFGSWLRCLVGSGNRKKIYVCLHMFGMEDLLTLVPSESMEIRRLTDAVRREWIQEAYQELRKGDRPAFVQDHMRNIVEALIIPWMRLRLGFATADEIMERMERISEDAAMMDKCLRLFGEAYFSGRFPAGAYLFEADAGIYGVDAWHQQAFKEIISKALTYFYNPRAFYSLHELVLWIGREFAKGWQGFPDGMIEKVLRLSPKFIVWKSDNGTLSIMQS